MVECELASEGVLLAVHNGKEVSRRRLMVLAVFAMSATWIGFTALLLIPGRVEGIPGPLEVVPLAGWAGIFAAFSLITFVPLVIAFVPPRVQLRLWWVVVGTSGVWGVALLRLFLGVVGPDPLSVAVLCFAAAAAGIYLLELRWLLRRRE